MTSEVTYTENIVETEDGLALFYRTYGQREGARAVIVCLAGLTRSSADFQDIGQKWANDGYYVVAPDMRGRGKSFYDPNPDNYNVMIEAQDVTRLLEHEAIDKAVFLGTSRGGLILFVLSYALFAQHPEMCQGIILNDVGIRLEEAGITRIQSYVGKGTAIQNWLDAVQAVKATDAGMTEDVSMADWVTYAQRTFEQTPEGHLVPAYDLAVGDAFRTMTVPQLASLDWTEAFVKFPENAPILVLRGHNSDLLSRQTLHQMTELRETCLGIEIPKRGHVPWLNEPESVAALTLFLEQKVGV